MTAIHAQSALTPGGWRRGVRVVVVDGRIASVGFDVTPTVDDERVDVLVPGTANVHSHAFQRGMAGLAEVGGPAHDNFWTWRTAMYRFALAMSPGEMEAVAAMAYVEMLEAGFTRVGEFHYLHHDPDGRAYGNAAEMAGRIAAAAGESGGAGIGLTLLPVFYAHAGFGGTPPLEGQRRFVCGLDQFGEIVEGCRSMIRGLPGAVLGIAPHSLRAVTPAELAAVVAMHPGGPIHIHAAEQLKEVEDCVAWSGARPVQWLLDHAAVDGRWCVIHATHLRGAEADWESGGVGEGETGGVPRPPGAPSPTPRLSAPYPRTDEISRLARSGALAGLCPVTEANLGDGTFPGPEFLQAGGRFGVGTDSNVLIGLADELRQLEYAQRLGRRLRNVISEPGRSTGRVLFDHAVGGGRAAVGWPVEIAVGSPADLVSLSTADVPFLGGDEILDSWIFTGRVKPDAVWVGGRKMVDGGRHLNRDRIWSGFQTAMRRMIGGI